MYGSWTFGSHDEALRQSQIATSCAVFTAALAASTSIHTAQGTLRSRYEYGTHELAVLQQQAGSASLLIKAVAPFPLHPVLGLKRDFPITQEEQPLDAPSSFFLRTAYLVSGGTQTPVLRPALQSLPQDYAEQFWSFVYTPTPVPATPPPAVPPINLITSGTENFAAYAQVNYSDIYEPIGQSGPVAISLVPPTILGLEDPGVDPTTLLGKAQLRWAAVPGASAYRVYINGVPQNPPILGQSFLATGLVVGQQYKFAVVAVAAGIDDSPLSNEIFYEHGSNEFSIVYTFPWGNTFKTGYVLVVKLGTPV